MQVTMKGFSMQRAGPFWAKVVVINMNSEKIDIARVGNVELLKRLRNRTFFPMYRGCRLRRSSVSG